MLRTVITGLVTQHCFGTRSSVGRVRSNRIVRAREIVFEI